MTRRSHLPRSRNADFVALARRLGKGEKLDEQADWEAVQRGVYAALAEVRLWELFGSRSEFLNAPRRVTNLARLVLMARSLAERDLANKVKENAGGDDRPDLPKARVYSSDSRRQRDDTWDG
jgi:hypothetical protein